MNEPRRLGRPPKVKAADTRQLILDVARAIFAQRGYELATNKEISEAANVTTSALYYHFSSKRDLYFAVYHDTQHRIYQRFGEAMEGRETFVAKLAGVLRRAHAMNAEDPTLARFAGAVRVDMQRHREMFEGFTPGNTLRQDFFEDLVGFGVSTGEIAADQRGSVTAMVLAFLIGLNDALSDDQVMHQAAIDGFLALIVGDLIRQPTQALQPLKIVSDRTVSDRAIS